MSKHIHKVIKEEAGKIKEEQILISQSVTLLYFATRWSLEIKSFV